MKRMRIAYAVLLCLLCAGVTYALPQQDEPKSHDAAKPAEEKPEGKPEGRQENAKPEKEQG